MEGSNEKLTQLRNLMKESNYDAYILLTSDAHKVIILIKLY